MTMGRSITVMALLLCFSLCVLLFLGLPVTTEARTLAAYSASAIHGDHHFPPPTEISRGGWEKATRRPPLVPRSPVGGPNKPYIMPKPPPPVPLPLPPPEEV